MEHHTRRRVHRTTALITFVAVVYWLFFQLNKGGPFRDINPFAEDPYDAVGSFASQGALLVGLLTYARALRLCEDPTQASKLRLILRGNSLVLLTALVALLTDAVAVLLHPLSMALTVEVRVVVVHLSHLLSFGLDWGSTRIESWQEEGLRPSYRKITMANA